VSANVILVVHALRLRHSAPAMIIGSRRSCDAVHMCYSPRPSGDPKLNFAKTYLANLA